MSAFFSSSAALQSPRGGNIAECSLPRQKGVFETGFHLTSKIFAAISLNIFFVCAGVCVLHICMAALVAALFAAGGRKNNENTTQASRERVATLQLLFGRMCCIL